MDIGKIIKIGDREPAPQWAPQPSVPNKPTSPAEAPSAPREKVPVPV